MFLALGLGVRDVRQGGQGQHMNKDPNVTLTKEKKIRNTREKDALGCWESVKRSRMLNGPEEESQSTKRDGG